MKYELLVDISDLSLANYFEKDQVTITDLLEAIDDLKYENEIIKERLEHIEQDIEDNYRPIEKKEQYDISEGDFI